MSSPERKSFSSRLRLGGVALARGRPARRVRLHGAAALFRRRRSPAARSPGRSRGAFDDLGQAGHHPCRAGSPQPAAVPALWRTGRAGRAALHADPRRRARSAKRRRTSRSTRTTSRPRRSRPCERPISSGIRAARSSRPATASSRRPTTCRVRNSPRCRAKHRRREPRRPRTRRAAQAGAGP